MNEQVFIRYRHLRRTPLALGALLWCCSSAGSTDRWASPTSDLALVSTAAQALAMPPAPSGNSIVVQNCNDAGNGSLRAAVANAQSSDTIDLTQLSCAKITLTTGQISVLQDSLTVLGPGADQLTIDGGARANHNSRIFQHTGTGTLHINKVALTDAKYKPNTHSALGGCIFSAGKVSLSESTMSECFAEELGAFDAAGGAIYAHGVELSHSKVTGNFVSTPSTNENDGGGIFSRGDVVVLSSTVSNNSAIGYYGYAGGIQVKTGGAYLFDSVLSGNSAGTYAAMSIQNSTTGHIAYVLNSTISGNHATYNTGGIGVAYTAVIAANSTITLNVSNLSSNGSGFRTIGPGAVILQDSIIANNIAGGFDSDVDVIDAAVTGNNNLITQHVGQVPGGTITACPRIGRLGDNGGETQTHPLLIGSPALDAGGSSVRLFDEDQRGTGYPRTHGSQPDIGAFESQGVTPDQIFSSAFEGRCR